MSNSSLAPVEYQVGVYLRRFSVYYPGIDGWYSKVLREPRLRSIWALTVGGVVAGVAITKHQSHAKLCHVSLDESARAQGLGLVLMRRAIGELLDRGARRVHVTTGEEIGGQFGDFFARCGFSLTGFDKSRYRRGADELVWSGHRNTFERILLNDDRSNRRLSDGPKLNHVRLATICTRVAGLVSPRLP